MNDIDQTALEIARAFIPVDVVGQQRANLQVAIIEAIKKHANPKTLADVKPGGRVRLGDAAATHDQQTIERVAKAMQASEQAQSGWTWADCSPIEVEGWMDLARAAVAVIPASQPVREQRAALWVQFAENGNMQFFTRDPDRAVEESFCYARPLTAYYEKPFPIEDLSRFKDLIGFAAWQAIQLPETDPRRDFIRQSGELIRIIDSAKEISK